MTGSHSQAHSLCNETNAAEFIDYLQGLLEKVPEKYRAAATMEVRALMHLTGDFNAPSVTFTVGIRNTTD